MLRGLVSYFVRRCLRVHTSHPGTNVIYNISLCLSLRSFPRISSFFTPLRYLVPLYMPLFSRLSTIVLQPFGFQYRRFPFYRCLIFRQPPPPLLSLVSFLSYNRFVLFFYPLVSSDSCRRIWAPPYIPYRSRHSDFFFCFIFFSGDFLFICRTRS